MVCQIGIDPKKSILGTFRAVKAVMGGKTPGKFANQSPLFPNMPARMKQLVPVWGMGECLRGFCSVFCCQLGSVVE